jgi:hypothetical protein
MGYSTHIYNDTPAQLSGTFVLNSTIESFVVEPKCIRVIDYPGHYNCTVKIEKYQNVDIRKLNLCRSVNFKLFFIYRFMEDESCQKTKIIAFSLYNFFR